MIDSDSVSVGPNVTDYLSPSVLNHNTNRNANREQESQ